MCKIAVMAGLSPENSDLNWEFVQRMGVLMSKGNSDGLGYTAVGPDGSMFGERWFDNDQAFDVRDQADKVAARYKGFLKGRASKGYNKFGTVTNDIRAITLHTRMATSERGLHNVHPFVDLDRDTSVIHNGVISNVTQQDNIRSTCDSERILNQYLDFGISSNPSRIQYMIDALKGNFACGIFTRDESGRRVLDVFRTRARLDAAYITELDAIVITTDISLVHRVCKDMDMNVEEEYQVEENLLLRMDAVTGEPILTQAYMDTANTYSYTPSGTRNTGYPGYSEYNHRYGNGRSESGSHKIIS